jgi:octaprenyl-diphosphate synthase
VVLAAIHATGALDHARRCARDEANRAKDAILQLPDSQYRKTLLQLANFSVERNH